MRGQAHTLEGFTAALLMVTGVIFALQATAVTPLSASTSNQHIQNQQRLVANDLLAAAAENGSLREATLHWNASDGAFVGSGDDGYHTTGGPPNRFGDLLNETFRDDRIAFNVYVGYRTNGSSASRRMVYMGSPSDNAVAATRTVTLYNGTSLFGPDDHLAVATAAANGTDDETTSFYAPDIERGSELFNVVEVRIVVWRM